MEKSYSNTQQKAATLEVKNVSKSFGEHLVLNNVSFKVNAGEIFVIMGPSGCGKSVLLKSVIGLERFDKGQILIDGLDATKTETHIKIRTALVFQAGALFNSLTVFDNLALYPREHNLYSKEELKDRVNDTLKILNLESCADRYPSALSGGMKKRVAIARALIMKPQLLLYDEPTSELDPINAASICEIIGTLKEEFGVTSIVVSHDKHLALSIADNVAMLTEGEISELAKPESVKESSNPKLWEFFHPVIDVKHPRFKNYLNV